MSIVPVALFDEVYLDKGGRKPTRVLKEKVTKWREDADHCNSFPRLRQAVRPHGLGGLWNEDDIPQSGWSLFGTQDRKFEGEIGDYARATCEMCLWERPRCLHLMRHEDTGLWFEVGRECAADLLGRLGRHIVDDAHRELVNRARRLDRAARGFSEHKGWRRVTWRLDGNKTERLCPTFMVPKAGFNDTAFVLVPVDGQCVVVSRFRGDDWSKPLREWDLELDGRRVTMDEGKEAVLRAVIRSGLEGGL